MKVVHICFWEKQGGAAIAANRLHNAMLDCNINSQMIVCENLTNDRFIIPLNDKISRLKLLLYRVVESRLLAKYRPYVGDFSVSFYGLPVSQHEAVKKADVIYLHWINKNILSIQEIAKILKLNKPVIWFCHDMWAFTGGCHHSFGCSNYKLGCGNCKLLGSISKKDIAFRIFEKKRRLLQKKYNLFFLVPSEWMYECISASRLFSRHTKAVIPNSINMNVFKIINRNVARRILNLPPNEKIVLFGADLGTNNPYKGWQYLRETLKMFSFDAFVVSTFGSTTNVETEISQKVYNFGRINDVYTLVLLYNACDVFVIPSLAESFGQTALESIACGTPVVGFKVGGIPDIVKHKKNGYLAEYKNSLSLFEGITWVLADENLNYLTANCRNTILSFSSSSVLMEHLLFIKEKCNIKS